ncbi:MAG TPA: phosphate ABC transporter substrate-binding protein PstS [Nitrospiraceae bacterium]|nr:phosphate ABC transporter substrate-binding protein PstS [Nitrospiraceae bacterium]
MTVVVLLGSLQGCSSPDREKPRATAPPGGVLLRGAGATFPSILYKQWFATYQNDHPKTSIIYDAVGSGEGILRFIGSNIKDEDKVDFGASDAAMNDDEISLVPKGVVLLPMTAGSVVLAYNLPDFKGDLKLSRKAYAAIFLGEIKNWNDPLIAKTNPGVKLPKLTINTVVRQDRSGTTYAFTKHLDAIDEKWHSRYGAEILVAWPDNAMRAKGNEGVAGLIKHAAGSIGYVSYEFAHQLGLKLATLENREGKFVAPTEQSCTAALATAEMPENLRVFIADPVGPESYPIVTFSWILLYKDYEDAAKAKTIRDLFQWCLQDGQKYAAQLGYVRLPANVIAKALSALNTISEGEKR